MNNTNAKLKEILNLIKSKLEEYMEINGTSVSGAGKFPCPNKVAHSHGDRNPSGQLYADGNSGWPYWKCYRCHDAMGDTIDFAAFVHGYEKEGPAFITETIPAICEELGIPFDPKDLLEEGKDIPLDAKLSSEAKTYIKNNRAPIEVLTGPKYRRNYSPELAAKIMEKYPIGLAGNTVPENNLLFAKVSTDDILIPVYQQGLIKCLVAGRPDGIEPKYLNSPLAPEMGLHYDPIMNATKGMKAAAKAGYLVVFEGNFNTIAALASGLENIIGCMGTAAVNMLPKYVAAHGIWEIVLCLDKDKHGHAATLEAAEQLLDLGVRVSIHVPSDPTRDYDMDFSADMAGTVAHIQDSANRIDYIEFKCKYRLDYLGEENLSTASRYERILSDVAKHGSPIMATHYSKAIVEYFKDNSISALDIEQKVRQVLSDVSSPVLHQIDNTAKSLSKRIMDSKTIEEKKNIAIELSSSIQLAAERGSLSMSTIATRKIAEFLSPDNREFTKQWTTGLANLDSPAHHGTAPLVIPDSIMMSVAGKPSHGKSVLVREIAWNNANINKDAVVIYYSLDDTAKNTLLWLLSGLSRVPFLDIIRDGNRLQSQLAEAKSDIMRVYGKNLFVLDAADDVLSCDGLSRSFKTIMRENPGKYPIIIIDSIYDMMEVSMVDTGNKRGGLDKVVGVLKSFTATHSATVIPTLHVTKNSIGRLTDRDIKESGSVNYRNNITLTVYNSFKDKGESSKMVTNTDSMGILPIIEVHTHKVKFGQPHQDYFFELDGPVGRLNPISDPKIIEGLKIQMKSDNSNYGEGTSKERDGDGVKESDIPKVDSRMLA